MWFNKNKEQEIVFYAAEKEFEYIEDPILPASSMIPKWYKNIPKSFNKNQENLIGRWSSTIKQCYPFLDALTTGYMITLPCDVEIKKINNETYAFWSAPVQSQQIMEKDILPRFEGLPVPEGFSEEIWRVVGHHTVKTPKGYSILITHPFNRFDLPFMALSGIVDSDEFIAGAAVNLKLKKDFVGIIEKGTPIAQIFPFLRVNWKHKFLPFNKDLMNKINWKINSTIYGSYLKNFRSKKTYK